MEARERKLRLKLRVVEKLKQQVLHEQGQPKGEIDPELQRILDEQLRNQQELQYQLKLNDIDQKILDQLIRKKQLQQLQEQEQEQEQTQQQ
jgi:hypothetical protein